MCRWRQGVSKPGQWALKQHCLRKLLPSQEIFSDPKIQGSATVQEFGVLWKSEEAWKESWAFSGSWFFFP